MTGRVKWFDPIKKYGFITTDNGEDVYVHTTGITKGRTYVGFNKGDIVELETKSGKKGTYATDVTLIKNEKDHQHNTSETTQETSVED
jgi:CspA family cold shock protein